MGIIIRDLKEESGLRKGGDDVVKERSVESGDERGGGAGGGKLRPRPLIVPWFAFHLM